MENKDIFRCGLTIIWESLLSLYVQHIDLENQLRDMSIAMYMSNLKMLKDMAFKPYSQCSLPDTGPSQPRHLSKEEEKIGN